MILGFKQTFPWGEPTHFREKILAGCGKSWITFISPGEDYHQFVNDISRSSAMSIGPILHKPKLHTIRLDGFDRWKAGRSIQMAYGQRTKNYQQFNKGIPELEKCVSVQKIQMRWVDTKISDQRTINTLLIFVDDKVFPMERYTELMVNDGFGSVEDFFKWFNKDFSGKIIHWTDLKY